MKTSSSKDRGRRACLPAGPARMFFQWAGCPRSYGFQFRPANRSGMALVVTLAIVVLLTFLVVAFFSAATAYRAVENSSAGGVTAKILAQGAVGAVQAELVQEIIAGSTVTSVVAGGVTNKIYYPTAAANMVPKRAISSAITATETNFANLVKQSGQPFYTGANIFSATASDSSAAPSANGRKIGTNRWTSPMLTGAAFATNQVPNWIYITPNGYTNTITSINAPTIIGRVAFNVYDVGGLLNANASGFAPGSGTSFSDEMHRKGSAVWADLRVLPGINAGAFAATDAWPPRWRLTGDWGSGATGFSFFSTSSNSSASYYERTGWRTAFLNTAGTASDRMFASRQDLIRYAKANPGTFTKSGEIVTALQFLTHWSRWNTGPSFQPDPSRLKVSGLAAAGGNDATGLDDQINPALPTVTVAQAFTRKTLNNDKSGLRERIVGGMPKGATVGEPLLKYRFALDRLALISRTATSAKNDNNPIYALFGLSRTAATDPWLYNHGDPGRILRLSQTSPNGVAQIGREPDMAELLKAAIAVGSLAKSSGNFQLNTATPHWTERVDDHVIQLMANIIDQYDEDSYPTSISFNGREIRGVENLPYLWALRQHQYEPALKYPGIDPSAIVLQPAVWNPHDPSFPSPGVRPTEFRITAEGYSIKGDAKAGDGFFGWSTDIWKPESSGLTPPHLRNLSVNASGNGDGVLFTWPSGISAFSQPTFFSQPLSSPFTVANSPGNYASGEPDRRSGQQVVGFFLSYLINNYANIWWDSVIRSQTGPLILRLQYKNEAGQFVTYDEMPLDLKGLISRRVNVVRNQSHEAFQMRLDPRSDRFGPGAANNISMWPAPYPGPGNNPDWPNSNRITQLDSAIHSYMTFRPDSGIGRTLQLSDFQPARKWSPANIATGGQYPGSLSENTDISSVSYKDPDTLMRPADGAYKNGLDGLPLATSNFSSRPIVLNRPFRSVAELGYVFRDTPWKSFDFFSSSSGDAALLDVFSILDSPDDALVANRVGLNSMRDDVARALLQGAALKDDGLPVPASLLTPNALSDVITAMNQARPFKNRQDFVTGLMRKLAPSATRPEWAIKRQREVAIRALGDVGETRNWNLFFDIIAQSGTVRAGVSNPTATDFIPAGESRIWNSVSIDRPSATIVGTQEEFPSE